jgi:hypothetical protein
MTNNRTNGDRPCVHDRPTASDVILVRG